MNAVLGCNTLWFWTCHPVQLLSLAVLCVHIHQYATKLICISWNLCLINTVDETDGVCSKFV